MNETILNLTLASLPTALLEDKFLQSLASQIPLNFTPIKKIGIKESIYQVYQIIEPSLAQYFYPLNKENELLDLMFIYQNLLLSLDIKEENNTFLTVLIITDGNKVNDLKWTKTKEESKIKIVFQTRENGNITAYESEIHYYDHNYKEQKREETKNEILTDFSDLFFLPKDLAEYYYTHFEHYQEDLNRLKILSEIKLEMETRPLSENYTFIEPMSLETLKQAIILCGINSKKIINKRLNEIFEKLEKNIPQKNEIVISKPLFNSMLKYIMGLTQDILLASGVILSKEEGYYNYYQISINSQEINITKEQIDENKAKELFYLSEKNQNIEGLSDFFGISRLR